MTANAEKYTMSKKLQFYAVFSVQINNHARRPYQKLKCPSCSKKKKILFFRRDRVTVIQLASIHNFKLNRGVDGINRGSNHWLTGRIWNTQTM